MIIDKRQRVQHYVNILYPMINQKDYVAVSEIIDNSVDYINSKETYSERNKEEKSLAVFLIKKIWESTNYFDINQIEKYVDDFFKEYDANYKKYVDDLIILSADNDDLQLSYTINYVNNNNWNNKLIENEKE